MTATDPMPSASGERRGMIVRIAIGLILVVLAVALYFSPWREQLTLENLDAVRAHVRGLWYGPPLFILSYILGSVLLLPATIFVVAAGLIWGWGLGTVYALIGGTFGALASFELSRYVVGDLVWKLLARTDRRVTTALSRAGFRSALILRFIPLIPFAVFNYGAGLTNLRTRDFFASTFIGLAPASFIITWCADALTSGAMSMQQAFQRMLIVGVLLAILVALPAVVQRLFARDLVDPDSAP